MSEFSYGEPRQQMFHDSLDEEAPPLRADLVLLRTEHDEDSYDTVVGLWREVDEPSNFHAMTAFVSPSSTDEERELRTVSADELAGPMSLVAASRYLGGLDGRDAEHLREAGVPTDSLTPRRGAEVGPLLVVQRTPGERAESVAHRYDRMRELIHATDDLVPTGSPQERQWRLREDGHDEGMRERLGRVVLHAERDRGAAEDRVRAVKAVPGVAPARRFNMNLADKLTMTETECRALDELTAFVEMSCPATGRADEVLHEIASLRDEIVVNDQSQLLAPFANPEHSEVAMRMLEADTAHRMWTSNAVDWVRAPLADDGVRAIGERAVLGERVVLHDAREMLDRDGLVGFMRERGDFLDEERVVTTIVAMNTFALAGTRPSQSRFGREHDTDLSRGEKLVATDHHRRAAAVRVVAGVQRLREMGVRLDDEISEALLSTPEVPRDTLHPAVVGDPVLVSGLTSVLERQRDRSALRRDPSRPALVVGDPVGVKTHRGDHRTIGSDRLAGLVPDGVHAIRRDVLPGSYSSEPMLAQVAGGRVVAATPAIHRRDYDLGLRRDHEHQLQAQREVEAPSATDEVWQSFGARHAGTTTSPSATEHELG